MELLVGILLPPVIDYLNKEVINDTEKFIVACLTCILAAVLIDYPQIANGNASNLPGIFMVFFTEAIGIFNLYWKNSFLRDQLQQKIGGGSSDTPQLG